MPGLPIVLANNALANGILTTFNNMWMFESKPSPYLDACMDLGLPSNARQQIYAYFETAPYPRRVNYGDTTPAKAFGSKQFSVINYLFKQRIAWSKYDERDDQTQSLLAMAQTLGDHFATIPERAFFEIVNGAASLLPSIPNAPDGAALFSATDGAGAPRFGVAASSPYGGNIYTGTSIASGDSVRSDFWGAIGAFGLFQDKQGQPLLDVGKIKKFTVLYHPAREQTFREAFKQANTGLIVAGSAGGHVGTGTAVAAAGVSNTLVEAGLKIDLWPSQRLTDTSDWYIFAEGLPHKAIFQQNRDPLEVAVATDETSDEVRNTGNYYTQWENRQGTGLSIPYSAIKVNV